MMCTTLLPVYCRGDCSEVRVVGVCACVAEEDGFVCVLLIV